MQEAEAIALEQQLFAEDETFERMWEIENRLVDSYLRGRLSPADRENSSATIWPLRSIDSASGSPWI
jgi:hypothetical protein